MIPNTVTIMMKRFLAVFLSVFCLFSMTACSGDNGNTAVVEPPADLTSLGKYDPPIDIITCMSYYVTSSFPPGQSAEDNVWTRLYKDMLGINVTYDFTGTNDDYTQIMNTYISSGEVPDMFTVTADQLATLMRTNLINKDIGAIFDKYATDTTKELTGWEDGQGENFAKCMTDDGTLAALPWTNSNSDSAILMYIREDWLKKLNLEAPTTIDQLETVLKAFVTQDPDGNGEDDTVGLTGTRDIFTNSSTLDPIFNAYGSHPTIWTEDSSGKLVYGSFQDNMIEPLQKLTEWYQDGLIDRGFATKDTNRAASLVQSGRCGVYFGSMSSPLWPLATTVSNDYDVDWLILPIPTADGRESDTTMVQQTERFHVVSSKCAHPEAMVLMMNAFTEKLWGPTEEFDTYYGEPGAELYPFGLFQAWPVSKNLDAYKTVTQAIDSGDTSTLNKEQIFYHDQIKNYLDNGVQSSLDVNNWAYTRIFYTGGSQDVINQLLENNQYTMDKWNGLGTQSFAQNFITVQTTVKQIVAEVILGQKTIDEFKTEIETLEATYGEQLSQEVNDWYQNNKKQ